MPIHKSYPQVRDLEPTLNLIPFGNGSSIITDPDLSWDNASKIFTSNGQVVVNYGENADAGIIVNVTGSSGEVLQGNNAVGTTVYNMNTLGDGNPFFQINDNTGASGVVLRASDNNTGGGVCQFLNAYNATSTTTGAVQITGGLAVGLNLFVGGEVSFQGGGSDTDSTIIGLDHTINNYSKIICIGDDNTGEGFESIIIGFDNEETSNCDNNVIIGEGIEVEDGADYSVAIGRNIDIKWGGRYGIALGDSAQVGNSSGDGDDDGDYGIAIGNNSGAETRYSIAMGYFATVDGGDSSDGTSTRYGIAIGSFSSVDDRGEYGIAIGYQSEADAPASIAIGRSAETDQYHDASIAIGHYARSTRANQLAFASEFETDLDETIREVAFNDPDDNPQGVRWPNPHYFEGPTFNLGRERVPVSASFSSDGATVTVTSTAHGLSTSDVIDVITSENRDSVENGEKTITVTDPNTFTFAESGNIDTDDLDYLPPRQTDVTYDGVSGTLTSSAPVSITNTTASTSPTTGAFTVAGGAGINNDLFVGGAVVLPATTNIYTDKGLDFGSVGSTCGLGGTDGATDEIWFRLNNGKKFAMFGNYLEIYPTTNATDSTTGALRVAGGIGVAGQSHFGPGTSYTWAETAHFKENVVFETAGSGQVSAIFKNNSLASGVPLCVSGHSEGVVFGTLNTSNGNLNDGMISYHCRANDDISLDIGPGASRTNPWSRSWGTDAGVSIGLDTDIATALAGETILKVVQDGTTATAHAGKLFTVANWDGATLTDYFCVENNGDVKINNTTASTSSTTGALTVAGGIGVAGKIHIDNSATGGIYATRLDIGDADLARFERTGGGGYTFSAESYSNNVATWKARHSSINAFMSAFDTSAGPHTASSGVAWHNNFSGMELDEATNLITLFGADVKLTNYLIHSTQNVTGTDTVTAGVVFCTGSGYTLTMPASPATGQAVKIFNDATSGFITVADIEGSPFTLYAGETLDLIYNGTNWRA